MMKVRHAALAGLVALAPMTATAEAIVRDCDTYQANARNLSRPFDEATRLFANGNAAFLSLALGEPACCGAHMMVTLLPADEPFALCALVTDASEMGWSRLSLAGAQAGYDPAIGLVVAIPGERFDSVDFVPFVLQVTVNQATGTVSAVELR
ncbi:hypothetical protein [Roseisalinus antarcticus]|uniref:Uncharacterized protein n=1 Tax=Roseisalinus antarcticus TaxID=254357 RepID=A0A1Y5SPR3_9RHOB|nr:hypothetical protein [Roseisalinus antarcticus]SLN44980.1 hypothetical protein ROA7023_01858 [Roseisalinus antarcticus]